jgi:hypothetical protein
MPPRPPATAPRPSHSQSTQPAPMRSMLDVAQAIPRPQSSAASISSNGNRSSSMTMSTTRTNSSYIHDSPRSPVRVHDSRWRFQDDGQFPRPREFVGVKKKYRAGRVSSVPLDLGAFE